jgi:DNA topoisomerase-1
VGLTYVSPDDPGIERRRVGRGFSYRDAAGARVADAATLRRIRALVIPPAWRAVWICADPNGHLQAVGQDQKGRRQYRYHEAFREHREGAKFEHMIAFAEALPRLRDRVRRDMESPGLGRRKVLATVVHLLETTMIRVGNAAYAKDNKSYGLTTLNSRHVTINGGDLRFHFKGKSGNVWRLSLHDRRVARIVRSCQELPGQHLFQYADEAGVRQAITSADVNAYLREMSGADITAKDFRTWTGTVLAATALAELGVAAEARGARKNVSKAIAQVAAHLGNTPTICRKSYVHPEILAAYLQGDGIARMGTRIEGPFGGGERLRPEEAAVLAFLKAKRRASGPPRSLQAAAA